MAEKKKYNSILISGRKDETLTYSRYIKDEESGESVKETLDKKVNVSDKLETQQIKNGAITNEKLAADSVGNTNLQDGSVSNEKLEDESITNEKLAENSITKDKLKDNTIGVEKLDPELRQTINAATGLPENLVETIQNVDDTLKDHQSQLDDKQSQIDDKQQQITANDEDISLLQTRSTQMEETIKSIAATGGASQATAVTYNNEKSKLTAVNIQSAVDEVVDKASIKDEKGEIQDTPFRVISNEEFILAVVDSEDRILFAIYRATGKQYNPKNDMYHISHSEEFLWVILDAANHPLLGIQQDGTCWAAKAQWLDDIKAIKEALSSIDETLKTFQPKEDGKGLINMEIADSFFYISNDEYIIAVVDAEDRILAGIKYDGKPYFPNHEMYSVITNEEWLYAIIDAGNKVLGGFRADDGHMIVGGIDISNFIANAIIDVADIKKRIAHLSITYTDEYLSVETDAEDKVIGYIAPDGSHYFYNLKSETIDSKVDKKKGKSLINEDVADAHSTLEDPEGRFSIVTDADSKVLSYRDKNGILHEEKIALNKVYDKTGKKINLATIEDIPRPIDIELSELDGVQEHYVENLFKKGQIRTYDSDFANKVFAAIGRKTGSTGCYSNNIECKEGDWFTRSDFGTGIVVVLDENGNILGDVANAAYKPTIQIVPSRPSYDFSKAKYVVFVVMLANINSEKIVKGKYIPTEEGDYMTIPRLRIMTSNIGKDMVTYIKSNTGKFYQLQINDSDGAPSIVPIQLKGIPASELPSNFPTFKVTGDFSKYYSGLVLSPIDGVAGYIYEIAPDGLVKRYLNTTAICPRIIKEKETLYYYGVNGSPNSSSGKLNIYKAKDNTFELVKGNLGGGEDGTLLLEPHDCLVISVSPLHYIYQRYVENQITNVNGEQKRIIALHVGEIYDGTLLYEWHSEDYPELWTDSHSNGDNGDYLHNNTISIDSSGNLYLNNKHANQILVIKRTWNSSEHTASIGEILWKIGGNRTKAGWDVPTRIKTTTEQQWFESHDGIINSNGLITMFDNRASSPSRILEFKIDTSNKLLSDFKSYTYKQYHGRFMGSAEKLDEGVYLVSWGSTRSDGTANAGIYDFKSNKALFEIKFDATGSSAYRIYGIP